MGAWMELTTLLTVCDERDKEIFSCILKLSYLVLADIQAPQ